MRAFLTYEYMYISHIFINELHLSWLQATNETYLDRIAAFGPRIPEDGIYGFLIEPSDRSGCSVVEPERSENWIALLERGGCSFIEKVRNMQQSGAVAVAVGDPDHVGWTTMFAPGKCISKTTCVLSLTIKQFVC